MLLIAEFEAAHAAKVIPHRASWLLNLHAQLTGHTRERNRNARTDAHGNTWVYAPSTCLFSSHSAPGGHPHAHPAMHTLSTRTPSMHTLSLGRAANNCNIS
eukprot:5202750-Prymnesium_polylepis.1